MPEYGTIHGQTDAEHLAVVRIAPQLGMSKGRVRSPFGGFGKATTVRSMWEGHRAPVYWI